MDRMSLTVKLNTSKISLGFQIDERVEKKEGEKQCRKQKIFFS